MSDDPELDRLVLVGVTGGVWPAQPVNEQPEVVLRQWQVYELDDGARHLVGWCAAQCEGRVSSAVKAFDPATRRCRMASGRVYELRGEPGWNGDAQFVWHRWRELFKVTECREVTLEVDRAMAQAAAAKGGA